MKDSYKELTLPELLVKREELRKQYGDVCFNGIIGHLDNPVSKRTTRRRLARLNTIIREYELGIRSPVQQQGEQPKQGRRQAAPGGAEVKTAVPGEGV